MKKLLLIFLLTLTVFVSVFCCTAQADVQPWNVCVEICHGDDCFSYDLSRYANGSNGSVCYLGKKSKWQKYEYLRTLPLQDWQIYNYILPHFEDVLRHFDYLLQRKIDATVTFDNGVFSYQKGQNGITIDDKKLFEILLTTSQKRITLPILEEKCLTIDQLKSITVTKSSFTTAYPNSNENRSHNIALATQSLNGTVVDVGQTFSFNQIVGKRTEQKGYKNAKVIEYGNYVDGVGGGVCQVSTTLYNALLLAGITPNAHQHSLVPSYVWAGFDAMVSDQGADLTFVNDTGYPLYIKGEVANKQVTFTIFGVPNKYRIQRVSEKEVTPFQTITVVDKQKYPDLLYTDQSLVVTNGSNGVKSQSFLNYYLGDKLIQTRLIRKNSYKRVDKVVAIGYLEHTIEQQISQNEEG